MGFIEDERRKRAAAEAQRQATGNSVIEARIQAYNRQQEALHRAQEIKNEQDERLRAILRESGFVDLLAQLCDAVGGDLSGVNNGIGDQLTWGKQEAGGYEYRRFIRVMPRLDNTIRVEGIPILGTSTLYPDQWRNPEIRERH